MYQNENNFKYHSNNQNKVIYGLAGPDRAYKALANYVIYPDADTVANEIFQAKKMVMQNPSIELMYIIDNYPGLRRDYVDSYTQASIENCAVFKDLLERSGRRIHFEDYLD